MTMPAWAVASLQLACSIVICAGILVVYCIETNSWSLFAPQPKHAPLVEFCNDGTFGNSCW